MMSFELPEITRTVSYKAPSRGGLFIDATTANVGYVTAGYVGRVSGYNRLKFQVRRGDKAYNYDFHYKPTQYPINMGSGEYRFRIMENVKGNQYKEVMCIMRFVNLRSKFVPFTVPNVYCNYQIPGPCVSKARSLCAKCETEIDALKAVTKWVAGNVSYDYEKAKSLASSKGYEPDPQKTLKERKGICFDYASLAAAMLRAVGIPCRVVTGYVDNIYYHSWISAYANGRWHRVDPTSMAVGHKFNEYRNRYVY